MHLERSLRDEVEPTGEGLPHVDGKLLDPGAVDLTGLRGEGHIFVDFLPVFGWSADEIIGEALHVLVGGVALGERGERGERLGRLRTHGVEVVDRVVVELVALREEGGVILAVYQFRVFLLPLVEDLGHAVHEGTILAELGVGDRFAHGLHLEVVDRLCFLFLRIVFTADEIEELIVIEVFLPVVCHRKGIALDLVGHGVDGPAVVMLQPCANGCALCSLVGVERFLHGGIRLLLLLEIGFVSE